jgi:hypothetical protein
MTSKSEHLFDKAKVLRDLALGTNVSSGSGSGWDSSATNQPAAKKPKPVASHVQPLRQEHWAVLPGSVHISSVLQVRALFLGATHVQRERSTARESAFRSCNCSLWLHGALACQWMVVYDAAETPAPNMAEVHPIASTSHSQDSDFLTSSATARSTYVLVLRGHALHADSFKNVQQKIVHAHKVGTPGAATTRLLDVSAVRQMAQMAGAHSAQEVWLPRGRMAGRLLPLQPPPEGQPPPEEQHQQVAARSSRPSLFACLEKYERELLESH